MTLNLGKTSVVTFEKKFSSDLNEIWYVGRDRWVMHDGMPYGRILGQGQGHEPLKVLNSTGPDFWYLSYFFCHVTLNLEENISCKNLIWSETKLLRRQRLVSDAPRNVRLYSRIKDRKSPLNVSRPSVPHGTNFFFIFRWYLWALNSQYLNSVDATMYRNVFLSQISTALMQSETAANQVWCNLAKATIDIATA